MHTKFMLTVVPFKVFKKDNYSQAFTPCEQGDIPNVFQVSTHVGDTVLSQSFVPPSMVAETILIAISLSADLGPLVEQADTDYTRRVEDEDAATVEDEADALRRGV